MGPLHRPCKRASMVTGLTIAAASGRQGWPEAEEGPRERCHQPGLEPLVVSRFSVVFCACLRFQGSLTSRLAPTRPNAPTFLMENSLPAVYCRLDFVLRATHLCLANAVIDQQFELPSQSVRRKRRTGGFLPARW